MHREPRRSVAVLGLIVAAGCSGGEQQALSPFAGEWIDLTHPFDETAVYWPTADPFRLEVLSRDFTEAGYFYAANRFSAAEHGGTHVDAPIHFAKDRWNVDEIPLERLMGPAAVVDVSAKALADPDYRIGVADLTAWEARHGEIPHAAVLLLRTGYGAYWPDRVRYMGTDARGPDAVAALRFPGLDPEAARWLVTERSIDAVGLDTPSIDPGTSTLFESHRVLFAANVPAFENVANLERLPATGAWVIALPVKIRHGSGAPLRIVAKLPEAMPATPEG
jgi:kynurenine formamidase